MLVLPTGKDVLDWIQSDSLSACLTQRKEHMSHTYRLTVSSLLAAVLFCGILQAADPKPTPKPDRMWRVKCATPGCTHTSDWNGDQKVVGQWSANHIRTYKGHLGGVEGKH
jgi:hypothetical protein